MKNNYAEVIVQNLRNRGEDQDYIINYLQGILNLLTDVYDNQEVLEVLKRQVQYSQIEDK